VEFDTPTGSYGPGFPGLASPIQVVTQQAGQATVTLTRWDIAGSLQVQVVTMPSRFVGVNVGAVNQTVTFADGQDQASLTVPILSGAPNPGHVDVSLSVSYTDPSMQQHDLAGPPLDLKIVASDPSRPPKVGSIVGASQGGLLTFNTPLDPAWASDVNNYKVSWEMFRYVGGLWGGLLGTGHHEPEVQSVRIQSAQYDSATNSVLLIPRQQRFVGLFGGIAGGPYYAKTSIRPGHRLRTAQGHTGQQGSESNIHMTPAKVEIHLIENRSPPLF
jgi:hypothetical protein